MIIVEGMDNTGKTTLIEQLSKALRIPTARTGTYPREIRDISHWSNWAAACPWPLILDRHPAISDLVYGPIIRKGTCSTPEMAQAARRNNFLIYCCPPISEVISTFHVREQMKGTHENLRALYQEYDSLMAELSPDFYYNYLNPHHYDALINQLARFIHKGPPHEDA